MMSTRSTRAQICLAVLCLAPLAACSTDTTTSATESTTTVTGSSLDSTTAPTSTPTSTGPSTEATTGSTSPAAAETTTSVGSTTTSSGDAIVLTDPAELLLTFADTWRTADWTAMARVATPDVVSTAQDAPADGGDPGIGDETIAAILDGCVQAAPGETSCEFVYAPADVDATTGATGLGLIYRLTYGPDATGHLMVTGLEFMGDAG